MALLDAEDQHVTINQDRHESVPPVDAFAAHLFKRENRQISRETIRPRTERLRLLAASQ
jgi:hypothetical protein